MNPGLFESPEAFMSFPEIATVIDSIDSVTESLYLQLLALIPAGGIGETPIYFDFTEIAKLLIFGRRNILSHGSRITKSGRCMKIN